MKPGQVKFGSGKIRSGQGEVKVKIRSGQVRPSQIRSDKGKVKTRSSQVRAGQCQIKDKAEQVKVRSRTRTGPVRSGIDQDRLG